MVENAWGIATQDFLDNLIKYTRELNQFTSTIISQTYYTILL
jgi:hypothetical protein